MKPLSTLLDAAAAALLVLLAATAHAQPATGDCDAPRPGSPTRSSVFSFQVENDLFDGTDAQYTNGVKFTWTSPNLTDFNDPLLPVWIRCSNDRLRRVVEWFHPERPRRST
jgi:hypothetical protein